MQILSTQRLKSGIERHWPRLQEALLLLALMAVATLIAYEYNVLPNAAGVAPQEHVIEPREIIALAGLLCVCLLILAWRFLVSQRQETARRIEVENRVRQLADLDSSTGRQTAGASTGR
jgi:hypothetical protein